MTKPLSLLVALLVVLTPAVAWACPVRFSGEDANRMAYFLTFLLLTTVPLVGFGGLLLYLRRRALELRYADDLARALPAKPPAHG